MKLFSLSICRIERMGVRTSAALYSRGMTKQTNPFFCRQAQGNWAIAQPSGLFLFSWYR